MTVSSVDPDLQAQEQLQQALHYYEETEEFDQALQTCEQALHLAPLWADAHNLRGVILEELERPLEAVGAYREALRLDPDFVEAQENLASLKAEFAARGRLVTIATFTYPTEAYIPKTRLEAEGIWSFVADADTVTANWLYSNAIGGVKLQVREADVEKAVEILNSPPAPVEWEEEETEWDEAEVSCPRCGSLQTDYEKYATRLVFLSWLLLRFPIPFLKRAWTCRDCGYSWKQKEAVETINRFGVF